MTYPIDLREDTNLRDGRYPVNLFRNVSPSGPVGRNVLYLHWHDHFEMIFAGSGQATFLIDSQPYDARPGDVLIVPSGGLHVGYAASEETVQYWSLVFNRSLLAGIAGDAPHEQFVAPYLDGRLRFPVRLAGEEAEHEPIRELMHSIVNEYDDKERGYELIVKARLYLLFALLSRQYLPKRDLDADAASDRRMERFKSLILHIQSNYASKLTLEDAARMMHMTPHHFCKVFKAAAGCTFVDFVNRHRMDAAERLLREGALSVTEVAENVGCGNLNYFTRLYKKMKGITPSQAKKSPG